MEMSRYIFSLVFLSASCWVFAQSLPDSVTVKDKEEIDWTPSLVRFGYDLGSTALTLASSPHQRQEIMAEMDFGKWFFVGEIGSQAIERGEVYNYRSAGNYGRIGLDKNLTPKLPGGHVVSAGFRYAFSNFRETMDYAGLRVENSDLLATWMEVTTGIRMKLWKQLYLGYQLRLRGFKRISDEEGKLQTFDVPGFGRNKRSGTTVRNGGVGFSYYVSWTIPFREKEGIPDED